MFRLSSSSNVTFSIFVLLVRETLTALTAELLTCVVVGMWSKKISKNKISRKAENILQTIDVERRRLPVNIYKYIYI